MEIPLIGLGTWELFGKKCQRAVKMALDIGYRHIDTAFAYENHHDIAKAMQGFDREKIFLTTKFGLGQVTKKTVLQQIDDTHVEESVEAICDLALKQLKTDYIDLLLIHWPDRSRPLEAILAAMHKMKEKGKIKSPGVSNYTMHHLQDAYDANLKVPFNQVEFHPYLYQKQLLEFGLRHGTRLIAYRPFGKGELLQEESLLAEIGTRLEATPAQVILSWLFKKKIPTVPKATSEEHLRENFKALEISLSLEDERQMDQLNKNFRYCFADWNEFDY